MEMISKLVKNKEIKLSRITVEGYMISLLINKFTKLIDRHCSGEVEVDNATDSTIVFIFWTDDISMNRIKNEIHKYNVNMKADIMN